MSEHPAAPATNVERPARQRAHALRSLLWVSPHLAESGEDHRASAADALLLDLAPERGSGSAGAALPAGEAAVRLLQAPAPAGQEAWARLHPISSGLTEADLEAVVGGELSGVYLRVETPQDVRDLDVMLRRLELERGLEPGGLGLIGALGSARGVLCAADILTASPRVTAVAFSPDDFAADMGVVRTRAGEELRYARHTLVVTARAAGIDAIDGPYRFVSDPDGFLAEAADARAVGYRGKVCLTASQVVTANAIFRPSTEEVSAARSILEAHEASVVAGGVGAALGASPPGSAAAARARALLARVASIEQRESAHNSGWRPQ